MPSYENLEVGEYVIELRQGLPGMFPDSIVAVGRNINGDLFEGNLGYLGTPVSEEEGGE